MDPRAAHEKPPFDEKPQPHTGKEAAMNEPPDFGEQSYVGHDRLHDKVALITGADSGIGRAVALAFAREGADVAIGYHESHEDAVETQRVVEEAGRAALLCPGDIAYESACAALVEDVVNRFGRIDLLINNAAFQGKAVDHFEEIDGARVERTFLVNVVSMFRLARLALPHMAPGSSIVNVASIQAVRPRASILDYAATKGAVVTFTKGLAQELVQRGIRVNCVAPGPVWTPLITQSFDEEKVRDFGKKSPMGRPAQPVEVAPAFVFLCSDDARYVNGEVLGVTGGDPVG